MESVHLWKKIVKKTIFLLNPPLFIEWTTYTEQFTAN